ncbi:hypothetical protein N7462_008864 [Penicillium macrosclerotiorum]|uniref:uncharacterized protein n=1 Tax=Penicillium macrosclerotiorum TaxID=303699 RepID=UPI0025479658|nr:uncharacterized protein N7462_008864 [Penicillium macrosclerotiorum]KAJ5675967.1 hypothetical protein N7462_008864 [Penicillium macrosclerotiorum]
MAGLHGLTIYHWLGGIVFAWALQCIYRLTFHKLSHFPGPRIAACSSWYFLYWIYLGRFPEQCERLFKLYNTDVLRVAPNQLVFRDPQALKDVVGRNDVYRGDFALRVIGFTGKNVSNIRDPVAHRRKRRLMNPGFSSTALARQEPRIIMPLVDKLVRRVTEKEGQPFNISDYFDCATSDIIGKLSFGADFQMLDRVDDHPFLHVLPNALRMSVIAQCIPEVYRFLSWVFQVGPSFLIPKAFRGVADFAAKHTRERAARQQSGRQTEHDDIMSIIINGTEKMQAQDPSLATDSHELLGEATTLVTGGGDTVATALTVTMWNLGRHADIYQELTGQLRARFARYEDIDSKTVSVQVPLVDAVLNESMRLNPVLPGPMWRRTDHPIPVCGYAVPGGTEVGVMRLSVFQHPDAFHRAAEFLPARWLQDLGDNLDAFQPFGIGPRTCIGRSIAMVEMRLILARLLWTFDWELVTQEYNNPEYVVLYRAPLWMKASKAGTRQSIHPLECWEPPRDSVPKGG